MRIKVPHTMSGSEREPSARGRVLHGAGQSRPMWTRPWDSPCVTVAHNQERGRLREVLAAMRKRRIIGPEYVGEKGTAAPEVVSLANEWSGLPYVVSSLNEMTAEQIAQTRQNLVAHYLGSV